MNGSAGLRVDYLTLDRLIGQPSPWWRGVLGVVGFEDPPPLDSMRNSVPVTASRTPLLDSEHPVCEVWSVEGSRAAIGCEVNGNGRVRYRHNDELLFGCVCMAETEFRNGLESAAAALRRATELAYQDIFSVIGHSGYSHLIRIWNYLPEINAESDGDERYRHFNWARQLAFAQAGTAGRGSIPAASALGSRAGSPVSIYFLAARDEPVMIENPRQVSAYRYPRQYGEHSPLFSRACLLGTREGANLFISGTASIVGHETIHRGDVVAQTRETMDNISALIDEANRLAREPRFSLDTLKYKVYVRCRRDQPAIAMEMRRRLKAPTGIVYLEADVCREDLLVEIEASGSGAQSNC